ncbi:hypothetical protein EDC61_103130 [Sulfuritortus calidifontis]|uniref:Dienelactone hydrolase n=1 Tax=Sulfuritortus calidifontis TaxID=1914471 RepID=A0A4V2UQW3_9PROT|nr:hypothetical protein [Sulfuritortus calidifontis]TCS73007.1 hypothetical protein EDC61_103130 [Sulfuritortus calidifontis]
MPKTLRRLFLALSLALSAAAFAAGSEVVIPVPSGAEIHSARYAAQGQTLAVFLTGEFGWSEYEYQAGAYLAGQGIETWVADVMGAYFLPQGMSQVRKLPDADLIAWLERVQKLSGKREIVLIATAHMAQPALRLARLWQAQYAKRATLRGAVLLFPLLYEEVEPGQEPVYDPVVRQARLDIAYLQPQSSAGYWWRERLKAALESSGSRVRLTVLPGLRDGYYRRGDATPEELAEGGKLGELLHGQIEALRKGRQ